MSEWLHEDVLERTAAQYCGRCGDALVDASCAACKPDPADTTDGPTIKMPARPTFGMALCLFGILIVTFLPYATVGYDSTLEFHFGVQNAIQIMDAIVVLGFALVCWQATWPLFKTVPIVWCLSAISTGVITVSIAISFVAIAVMLTGVDEIMTIQPAFNAGYGWVFIFLTVVAQPAIIEELAFRGVIFDGLRTTLSDRETVVVTALLFMVIHMSPVAFPHLLIMGLLLGWMRLKSGSIWPCILMHATHNALVIAYEYRVTL